MKKTKLLIVPSLLLLSGALVGCGGNKGTGDNTLVINFWHTFGDTVETAVQAKCDTFAELVKRNEGIDLKVELTYKGGYNEIKTMITDSLSVGDTPTIAVAYPDHVADYIAAQNGDKGKYVVNMMDYIDDPRYTFGTDDYLGDNEGIDDFDETVIQEGTNYTIDGMYSLSFLKSTEIMFYNVDLALAALPYFNEEYYFPTYGVDLDPGELDDYLNATTFSELYEYGDICLKHRKDIGVSDQEDFTPILYDSDGNLFITNLLQNDVSYCSVGEDGKGRIDFETGENRLAAEALVADLETAYQNGLLATKGTLGEYSSNYFKQGQCVFSIGSTGGSGYQFPEEGSFEVGACRVPSFNDEDPTYQYITQGVNLTLLTHPGHSRSDELKLYGFKLLKYLTSTNVNVDVCINGSEGYMPVRKSCLTTNKWLNFLKIGGNYALVANVVGNKIGSQYLYTPAFRGSASLRTQAGSIITEVLKNSKNITEQFNLAINNAKIDMD